MRVGRITPVCLSVLQLLDSSCHNSCCSPLFLSTVMRPWLALHCDTAKNMQKRQEYWLVGKSHTCLSEHGATTSCDCFISPPFCGCSGCLSADTPPQLSTSFLSGAGLCSAALSSSASLLASLSVNKELAGGNPLQQRKLSANGC